MQIDFDSVYAVNKDLFKPKPRKESDDVDPASHIAKTNQSGGVIRFTGNNRRTVVTPKENKVTDKIMNGVTILKSLGKVHYTWLPQDLHICQKNIRNEDFIPCCIVNSIFVS